MESFHHFQLLATRNQVKETLVSFRVVALTVAVQKSLEPSKYLVTLSVDSEVTK